MIGEKAKLSTTCVGTVGPDTASLPYAGMSLFRFIDFSICDSNADDPFLDAPPHLHKRVCPSVRPSVRP